MHPALECRQKRVRSTRTPPSGETRNLYLLDNNWGDVKGYWWKETCEVRAKMTKGAVRERNDSKKHLVFLGLDSEIFRRILTASIISGIPTVLLSK